MSYNFVYLVSPDMPVGAGRAHVAVGPDVELADGRAGLVHSGKGKGHHTDLEIKRKGYYRLGDNIVSTSLRKPNLT